MEYYGKKEYCLPEPSIFCTSSRIRKNCIFAKLDPTKAFANTSNKTFICNAGMAEIQNWQNWDIYSGAKWALSTKYFFSVSSAAFERLSLLGALVVCYWWVSHNMLAVIFLPAVKLNVLILSKNPWKANRPLQITLSVISRVVNDFLLG